MANTVTFQKNATIVVLPAPGYPEKPGDGLQQTIMRCGGGRVVAVKRYVGTIDNPELLFELTESEYDDLHDFIYTTVDGALNSFTYTDPDSVGHTAYYLSGLPAQSDENDVWIVRLRLAFV